MSAPFTTTADAGWALLKGHHDGAFALSERSGSIAGQMVCGRKYLTPKQFAWVETLLDRAGLPPLSEEVMV